MAILKYYNGTSWVEVTSFGYYVGSAWKQLAEAGNGVLKYYDGAAWQEVPFGGIWDGQIYPFYMYSGALRGDSGTPDARSIYIDVSDLNIGDQVKVTMTTNGTKADEGRMADLIEDLPKSSDDWPYVNAHESTLVHTLDTTSPIEYILTKTASGVNTLVFNYSINLAGTVGAVSKVELYEPTLWDGIETKGYYVDNDADNRLGINSGYSDVSIKIDISSFSVGDIISVKCFEYTTMPDVIPKSLQFTEDVGDIPLPTSTTELIWYSGKP